MKVDKTNDELIKMFEANIAKEYGQIIKKWKVKCCFCLLLVERLLLLTFIYFN
jgi:hypothetical protein